MNVLNEYYDALDRLVNNNPIHVPINSKINNDTVALEAGRKRGSIKKGREVFFELCIAIKVASEHKEAPIKKIEQKLEKYKKQANEYRLLYEAVLNRELMLIERLNEFEKIEKQQAINHVDEIF